MKNIFKPGDTKTFHRKVRQEDLAKFDSGTVHELYSTFSIARDAEWCTRLFVLEMKEINEEGIGTFVNIQHLSPAKVGSEVEYIATMEEMKGNELICSFVVKLGEKILATGKTGQKILKKDRLNTLLSGL